MKEETNREWERRVRDRPIAGMSKWARGGEMVSSLAFLNLTQCQHWSDACQERPYHNDSFDFWNTDFIAKAMCDHMYHRGNDSIIKCTSSALKENTNRGTGTTAPPATSEAIRSEGKATCTELSREYSRRNLSGATRNEIKQEAYPELRNITWIHNIIISNK